MIYLKLIKQNQWWQSLRSVVRLSVPLVLARIVSALNGFIGMLMIAHLGKEALAAGALIAAASNTIMIIVWGLMFSVGVLIGQTYGKGEYAKIGSILQAGILFACLISIPAGILMWYTPSILLLLGQPRFEVLLARYYFHPATWMILPSLICVCFSQFCMAINRARLVLIWSIISLPITLLLAWMLAFGFFFFPQLGIAGVALANVIVWTMLFIILVFYFTFHPNFKAYALWQRTNGRVLNRLMWQILKLGSPISLQFGGELGAFAMLTLLIGLFGSVALGAQQIVTQIGLLVMMLPFGISQAVAILISQSMGRKHYQQICRFAYMASILGLCCMLLIGFIYWYYPTLLIFLYLHGHQVINSRLVSLAISLFAIMAILQFFDAIRNIMTGALRGLQDTSTPLFTSLFVIWFIGIPSGYLLAFHYHFGPAGLFWGFAFGFFLGALFLSRRFFSLSRRFIS